MPTIGVVSKSNGKLTRKDAKCSDVITALNPTTGTKAAKSVPKTTCIEEIHDVNQKQDMPSAQVRVKCILHFSIIKKMN